MILRLGQTVHQRKFKQITGLSFDDLHSKKELNFNKVHDLAENISRHNKIYDFAQLILKLLAHKQPPWWACFAQDVSHYTKNKEWNLLARKLGLANYEKNETILIWIYPAKIVGSCYKPTVIESGCDPHHFPVIDDLDQETMPLIKKAKQGVREILHKPIDPKYVDQCYFWIGRITEQIRDDAHQNIKQYRKLHWNRLKKRYSGKQKINLWIKRHNHD